MVSGEEENKRSAVSKNQKNFRAHPYGMLWLCQPGALGGTFGAGAMKQ